MMNLTKNTSLYERLYKRYDGNIFLKGLSTSLFYIIKRNFIAEKSYLALSLPFKFIRCCFFCNKSNFLSDIKKENSFFYYSNNNDILIQSYSVFFFSNFIKRKKKLLNSNNLFIKRYVSRVRVSRYTGTTAIKVHGIKTEWYINSEKEFLNERNKIPDGYVGIWHEEDLKNIHPNLRKLLHLKCASNKEIHKWRKLQLRKKFQIGPFDISSPPVQLACLTEKILNLRAHLIKNGMDHPRKMAMSIWLARRQKCMKYLYRTDFELYKYVCKELKIKCVRFSIPDSRDYSRAINPIGVDGDRCKFLIRQKLWKARYRPRPVKQADGQTVRYTRHPIEQPPEDLNLSKKHSVELSSKWPYGLREERIQGTYIKRNPTECGIGYCPVPILF